MTQKEIRSNIIMNVARNFINGWTSEDQLIAAIRMPISEDNPKDSPWKASEFLSPQYRPWKTSEVPVGAMIKNNYIRSIITACDNNGLIYAGHSDSNFYVAELFMEWTYSTDYGKTWQPCGVLIN